LTFGAKTIFVSILLTGCARYQPVAPEKFHTIEELQTYVLNPANGLTHQAEFNGSSVRISYLPKELLIITHLENLAMKEKGSSILQEFHKLTPKELARKKKKIEGYEFFAVSVRRDDEALSSLPLAASLIIKDIPYEVMQFSHEKQSHILGEIEERTVFFVIKSDPIKLDSDFDLECYYSQPEGGLLKFHFNVYDLKRIPHIEIPTGQIAIPRD
jgi:hypothetical protein